MAFWVHGFTWCVLVISLNLKYEMWQNHMEHSENRKIELTQFIIEIIMVMEKLFLIFFFFFFFFEICD